MKITQSSTQNLQQSYQSSLDRASQSTQASQPIQSTQAQPTHSRPVNHKDSVEFSEQAQLLQKAAQQVEQDDPARLQRVAKLQEQVQNDTYQVPVQQLAARLLNPVF